MPLQLRWIPSFSASAMHIAERLATGRILLDARLAELLAEPAMKLRQAAETCNLSLENFWRHLLPLAAQIENNRQLAQRVAVRLLGAQRVGDTLAFTIGSAISDLEAAYRLAVPDIDEQLRLRIGPLREMWEGRGPGLMILIGQRTEPELIVDAAEIIVVQPVTGGWGAPHLPYNSVSIEGVLTNPRPELPEVVRIAWMVAQLNCDLPAYSQNLLQLRVPYLTSLAMIPPVLTAAEEVELLRYDVPTIAAALEAWDIPVPDRQQAATILWQWFEVFRQGDSRWRTALEAMEQLFPRTT